MCICGSCVLQLMQTILMLCSCIAFQFTFIGIFIGVERSSHGFERTNSKVGKPTALIIFCLQLTNNNNGRDQIKSAWHCTKWKEERCPLVDRSPMNFCRRSCKIFSSARRKRENIAAGCTNCTRRRGRNSISTSTLIPSVSFVAVQNIKLIFLTSEKSSSHDSILKKFYQVSEY